MYIVQNINIMVTKTEERKKNATKNTGASMVWVVEEDVIIFFAVNDLATSTLNCSFVSHEYSKEILHCDIVSSVVLKHMKSP